MSDVDTSGLYSLSDQTCSFTYRKDTDIINVAIGRLLRIALKLQIWTTGLIMR